MGFMRAPGQRTTRGIKRGIAMGFMDEYRNGSKCCSDYVNRFRYKKKSSLNNANVNRNRDVERWKGVQ